MSELCVFAFGCHPDDIEFLMSGTLFALKQLGAEIHYMNPANGSLGSNEYTSEEITRIRREEGKKAADYLGAVFHESIVNDLEVFYTEENVRRVTAIVREIQPDIMLLTSLEDYMEDHMNAARIGSTAAFCRGMKNYKTIPEVPSVGKDIAVYHAMPYGLYDMMNRKIAPDFYVDVEQFIDRKVQILGMHESQKNWLDETQGMDAYLETMREMTAEVGRMSDMYTYAEGWRRHNPLGFCAPDYRPFEQALKDRIHL